MVLSEPHYVDLLQATRNDCVDCAAATRERVRMKRYLTRAPLILAAVAGGLILLGGTKALAATSIRCVNSTDASCQHSYSTIQAAVNAAFAKDIILVGRGIYSETV